MLESAVWNLQPSMDSVVVVVVDSFNRAMLVS